VWEDSIDAGHDRPARVAANDRTEQRFTETRGEPASAGN